MLGVCFWLISHLQQHQQDKGGNKLSAVIEAHNLTQANLLCASLMKLHASAAFGSVCACFCGRMAALGALPYPACQHYYALCWPNHAAATFGRATAYNQLVMPDSTAGTQLLRCCNAAAAVRGLCTHMNFL